MIVKDLIAGYRDSLEEKELNPHTIKAYLSDIRIFQNTMEIEDSSLAKALKNIKENDVKKYLAFGKASTRTQRRRHTSLFSLLTYCTPEITSSNPLDKIKPPKREDANPSFITREEFDILTESLPPYPNYKRSVYSHTGSLSMMCQLFLDGFGIGEILEKTYKEITETRVKRFTRKKINAYQKVFLNTFGRRLSEEPDEKFYRNKHQEPISGRSVSRNFSEMGTRVLVRNDINPRTVHNGYLKIWIDEILAENSETTIHDIAEKTGAHHFTIQGLINR